MQGKYRKIAVLFLLYLSQGMPFGFQATALPVYLREQGISLTAIGFIGVLAAPWMLKPFWAPLVDRYWFMSVGKRKSWIIPLQVLLIAVIILASSFSTSSGLQYLLIAVFLMNLIAATQDIAVDGLAVDILGEHELGLGNAAQVVGYKSGMVISGGILVWMSAYIGWKGQFLVMAAVTGAPLAAILFYRESISAVKSVSGRKSIPDILRILWSACSAPGAAALLTFIATYKLGESMIDVMFKPFLIDNGFTAARIGLLVGTWGMISSLAGSLAGGILASRSTIIRALCIASILRIIPLCGELILTFLQPDTAMVVIVSVGEHFFGGMLTTIMFAFMMSGVIREIGATHYTMLAGIEVIGKSPGAWASGFLADTFGYSGLFGIGVFLSCVVIGLFPLINKSYKNRIHGSTEP